MLLLIVVSFITDESDSRVAMKCGGDTPVPKNQATCIGFLNGGLLVVFELTGSWTAN